MAISILKFKSISYVAERWRQSLNCIGAESFDIFTTVIFNCNKITAHWKTNDWNNC